jgi:hypothetical protein
MLDATMWRVLVIDELGGDRAFDGDPQRGACMDRGVFPNFPNKANRGRFS